MQEISIATNFFLLFVDRFDCLVPRLHGSSEIEGVSIDGQ